VLTLGPLMVAASIVLGNSAMSAASSVATAAPLLATVRALSGFTISWGLIMLLYRLVPDTKVQWRAAALGSFLAAVAWEVGKWAFGLYVQKAVRNSWYGSMALLPLFMFWIYITWTVVLIGLEITYVVQLWGVLKRRYLFSRQTPPGAPVISDMRWVLNLGVLVYRNFRAGRMTEIQEAAEALMLPNEVIYVLLEAMEKAGLVHEARTGAYVLARPAEQVSAYDLLTAARALCEVPPELSEEKRGLRAPGVVKLEELEAEWAKGQVLPRLAGDT
jgi:membrane protein